MGNLIQLLGYPRSGSTWVAEMLSLAAGPFVPEPFNMFQVGIGSHSNIQWLRGLDPPANEEFPYSGIQQRITPICRKWCGVNLANYPDAQAEIYKFIDEIRELCPWAVGWKQLVHVPEFAERCGGRLLYLLRNPVGVVASHAVIVRDTAAGVSWPMMMVNNMEQYQPGLWATVDAPDTICGKLAKVYKLRAENDWRRLQPLGAKLLWFEDFVVNNGMAWGDLLHWLDLEPTAEFEKRLQETMAPTVKPIAYDPELMDAVKAVFGNGWGVGSGSA